MVYRRGQTWRERHPRILSVVANTLGVRKKTFRDAKMCTAKWAKRTSEGVSTASILQLRLVRWQDRKRSSGVALLPRCCRVVGSVRARAREKGWGRGSEGTQERVHVDTDARGMDRIDRGSSFRAPDTSVSVRNGNCGAIRSRQAPDSSRTFRFFFC